MTAFLSFEAVTDPQRLQPFVNRLWIPTEIDEALRQKLGGAIGVSGGKDSSALLITVSALIRTRYPHVEIVALHADTGNANHDLNSAKSVSKTNRLALHVREDGICVI